MACTNVMAILCSPLYTTWHLVLILARHRKKISFVSVDWGIEFSTMHSCRTSIQHLFSNSNSATTLVWWVWLFCTTVILVRHELLSNLLLCWYLIALSHTVLCVIVIVFLITQCGAEEMMLEMYSWFWKPLTTCSYRLGWRTTSIS
jgi:hypothetical protein